MTALNVTDNKIQNKVVSNVTMMVTLVSFAMLFATLMLGFTIYRFTSPVWPPQGMAAPSLLFPALSTLIIALSSLAFFQFEKTWNRSWLLSTLYLGLAFMVCQSFFWHSLKANGIFVSSGIYASIMYAFTWIHAAHIVGALALLGWLVKSFDHNDRSDKMINRVSNVGKFWHFLGVIWLIMFITIFVL